MTKYVRTGPAAVHWTSDGYVAVKTGEEVDLAVTPTADGWEKAKAKSATKPPANTKENA